MLLKKTNKKGLLYCGNVKIKNMTYLVKITQKQILIYNLIMKLIYKLYKKTHFNLIYYMKYL